MFDASGGKHAVAAFRYAMFNIAAFADAVGAWGNSIFDMSGVADTIAASEMRVSRFPDCF